MNCQAEQDCVRTVQAIEPVRAPAKAGAQGATLSPQGHGLLPSQEHSRDLNDPKERDT